MSVDYFISFRIWFSDCVIACLFQLILFSLESLNRYPVSAFRMATSRKLVLHSDITQATPPYLEFTSEAGAAEFQYNALEMAYPVDEYQKA